MMNLIVIFAAVLPVAILLWYIYRKDNVAPEPTGQLVKAFAFGIVSVFVSFCFSIPLNFLGFYTQYPSDFVEASRLAFMGAAVPEEFAKFLMLWLFLRKNRHFDEKIDGIVYAVCVSLGFAAFENVMYLFQNYDDFVSVGVSRALFSVPGHFCFGVLMGYYYSRLKLCGFTTTRDRVLVLAAPILAHGVYDSLLFFTEVSEYLAAILIIIFVVFCFKMWKFAKARIEEFKPDEEKNR